MYSPRCTTVLIAAHNFPYVLKYLHGCQGASIAAQVVRLAHGYPDIPIANGVPPRIPIAAEVFL